MLEASSGLQADNTAEDDAELQLGPPLAVENPGLASLLAAATAPSQGGRRERRQVQRWSDDPLATADLGGQATRLDALKREAAGGPRGSAPAAKKPKAAPAGNKPRARRTGGRPPGPAPGLSGGRAGKAERESGQSSQTRTTEKDERAELRQRWKALGGGSIPATMDLEVLRTAVEASEANKPAAKAKPKPKAKPTAKPTAKPKVKLKGPPRLVGSASGGAGPKPPLSAPPPTKAKPAAQPVGPCKKCIPGSGNLAGHRGRHLTKPRVCPTVPAASDTFLAPRDAAEGVRHSAGPPLHSALPP